MRYLKIEFNKEAFCQEVVKPFLRKAVWCLKQMLPLTYRSYYKESDNSYFSVFKMWLGQCYKIDKVKVDESIVIRDQYSKRKKGNVPSSLFAANELPTWDNSESNIVEDIGRGIEAVHGRPKGGRIPKSNKRIKRKKK